MALVVDEHDNLSLLNLARGGAIEQFDLELKRVLDNILDPNTGEGAREIMLKVKIKPEGRDRDLCSVAVGCASKLQPVMPVATRIFVGRDPVHGAVAMEHNPQQMRLELPSSDLPDNVARFPRAENNQ